MSRKAKLVVLASGSGTNLQAIIDACRDGRLNAEVRAVVSDKSRAFALQRASDAVIPSKVLSWKKYAAVGKSRTEYDTDLAVIVQKFSPDFVALAGWMRILGLSFLAEFPNKVINLHPALPGTFPGTDAIKRAYQAFQDGKLDKTGVMAHYVPDEGVDVGPVILKEEVPIYPDDSLETLEERIHKVEHRILVNAISSEISKLME